MTLARFWSKVAIDGRSYGPKGNCWPYVGSLQKPGGYDTQRRIAEGYDVTQGTISNIARGVSWANLDNNGTWRT